MTDSPALPAVARRAAAYLLPAGLAFALAFAGSGADRSGLRVPFAYAGDVLLILPMVKATLEGGTHWHTDRLGAPGMQELYDFPVIDHLHFAAIRLLAQADPDPVVAFNLYYLLTYPLTVLVGVWVLRQLGLSLPAAAAGGLLYAFAPYHLQRGVGHYFLSAYYTVPLAVLVAVWIGRGRLPFFQARPLTLSAILIALVTSAAGAYYAFFACVTIAAGGVYGWAAGHGWRAAASAGLVIGVLFAAGVANHAPAIAYQARYGQNSWPHTRTAEEAEEYGLKLAQLVLPPTGHRVDTLAAVRGRYASSLRPAQNENESSALGTVGAVGFLVLLAAAVLPVRKPGLFGPLAFLAAALTLVGTVGGLGAVFNHLVSPQVRCYNRVSIILAFVAIAFVCWAVDRALPPRPLLRTAVFAALAAFGVWDQTPAGWLTDRAAAPHAEAAEKFRADREYYGHVEAALGPGAAVFCLPFVEYPETLKVEAMGGYDHARGYLHTATLRWSYGAMKGREADAWQREASALPVPAMLDRLVLGGFDAVYLDRNGFPPGRFEELSRDLTARLGPPVAHPAGDRAWYGLQPHRQAMLASDGADGFERRERELRERVTVLWLGGFRSFNPVGEEWKHRLCGPSGQAVFINPTDRPRRVRIEAVVRSAGDFPVDLRIDGEVWKERLALAANSPPIERELLLPPGRSTVRFTCRTPAGPVVSPPWNFRFFVALFRLTEADPAAGR